MSLVLVCLLCLPSALALRLDTRLAGQRESYFYGARSKPTAAPSQTLYSPPPAVERESARAPASPSSRASYSFGARNPQVGRLVGEPASESSGTSRGRSDERPIAPATVSSQQRGSGKVDYSFGARLRTPSVQRTEVVSASEPVFSSRSVETPSTRSGKTDYSFGARLKRTEAAGLDSSSRSTSLRPKEVHREEASVAATNYSFGARLKTISSQRSSIATFADAELPTSRSFSRPMVSSGSVSDAKISYSFGARLLRGGAFETALIAQGLVARQPPIPSESSNSRAMESYAFGARLMSSTKRSVSLV